MGAQWTYQEFSSFLTAFDETLRILPPAKYVVLNTSLQIFSCGVLTDGTNAPEVG